VKWLFFLIPFVIGGVTVIQSGLNRQIGLKYGWPVAGMINNASGFAMAAVITLILIFVFAGKGVAPARDLQWWYFVPGCLGMLFVMGIPLAFDAIGASRTFIILVASQLLFGLLWDRLVLQLEFPLTRFLGVALAWAGALIATL
jgi:transporter family-2 protein